MNTKSLFSSILLALILAIGLEAVWFLIAMIASAISLPDEYLNAPKDTVVGAAKCAVLVPSPGMFAVARFLIVPLELKPHKVGDASFDLFLSEYHSVLNTSWLPLFVLLIVSVALCVWCYLRHRQYSNHGALAWAIFVFLFGTPGLIGYLLHRNWPAEEICAKCGVASPRDRDDRLKCGTEFPLPALKGIEIFA